MAAPIWMRSSRRKSWGLMCRNGREGAHLSSYLPATFTKTEANENGEEVEPGIFPVPQAATPVFNY